MDNYAISPSENIGFDSETLDAGGAIVDKQTFSVEFFGYAET